MKAPALSRLECYSIYVDGWRDVVVLSTGRRWFVGFEAATLASVKFPIDELGRRLGSTRPDYSRSRLARRLRRNAKSYPGHVTRPIKAAIAELGRRGT